MTRFVVLGVAFVGALAWAVPAQAQTTVKFQQGKNGYSGVVDTYVDQFWDDFFGGVERIETRHWDAGAGVSEKMNILIMFDVTSLPLDATVTSAKLTLYNTRARGQNGDVPILEKVTSTWDGKTKWSTQPSAVATSGVCPPVTGGTPYQDDPVTPEVYVITGLESLVQGWILTPASNFGMKISANSNLNFQFASSNYPDPTDQTIFSPYRPELEVTFTTPTPTPPPTITVNPPGAPTPGLAFITVTGTASATSPATLTQITWQNMTAGFTGPASGTTSWTASVQLISGSNVIQFTATDSLGGTATSSVTVNLPSSKRGHGKGECGLSAVQASSEATGIVALGLALLLIAASRRPRRNLT
jgi:hypothetical protein